MIQRILCITLLACTVAACDNKEDLLPEPVTETPLELDPTQPVEVIGWWSNDNQLLHIRRDSGYIVYPDRNRYNEPTQRGRWWKQSYATMWFEPYTEFDVDPYRGQLVKDNEQVMLRMGDLPAMRKLGAPPTVMEDHLFGTWSSSAGVLSLRREARYRFSPAQEEIDKPVAIAGHSGTWAFKNGEVVLTPDAPNLATIRLQVSDTDAGRKLHGMNSAFTKLTDSSEQ